MNYIPSIIERADVHELAYVVASAYEPDLRKRMDTQMRNLQRPKRARITVLVMILLIVAAGTFAVISWLNEFVQIAILSAALAIGLAVILPVVRSRMLREITHAIAPLELAKAYWRVTLLPAGGRNVFVVDPQSSEKNWQTVCLGEMDMAALQDLPQIPETGDNAGLEQDRMALVTSVRLVTGLKARTTEFELPLLPPDTPNNRALKPTLTASEPIAGEAMRGAAIWPGPSDEEVERFAHNAEQLLTFAERPFGVDSQTASALLDRIAGYTRSQPSVLKRGISAATRTQHTPAGEQADERRAVAPLEEAIDHLFVTVTSSLRAEVQTQVETLGANLERGRTSIQLKASQRKDEVMRRQDDELGRVQTEITALEQTLTSTELMVRSTQEQLTKFRELLDEAKSQANTAEQRVAHSERRLVDLRSQLEQVERRLRESATDPGDSSELGDQVRRQEILLAEQQAALQKAQTELAQARDREASLAEQLEFAERQVDAPMQQDLMPSNEVERLRQELASIEKQLERGEDQRLEVRYDRVKTRLDKISSEPAAALQSGQKGQAFGSATGSVGLRIDIGKSRRKVAELTERVDEMQQRVSDTQEAMTNLQRRQREAKQIENQAATARQDLINLESKVSEELREKATLESALADKQKQLDELRDETREAQQAADSCAKELEQLQVSITKAQESKQSIEAATAKQITRIENDMQTELEAHDRPLEAQRQRITEHIDRIVDLQGCLSNKLRTLRLGDVSPRDAITRTDDSLFVLRASAVQTACDTVTQALELPRRLMRDAQQFVERHSWQIDGMPITARTDVFIPLWFCKIGELSRSWQAIAVGRSWSPQEITADQHIRWQMVDDMKLWLEALDPEDASPAEIAALRTGMIVLRDKRHEITQGLQDLRANQLVSGELIEHIKLAWQSIGGQSAV